MIYMKKYFNIILIGSVLLLIFPFLALPELWEHIYVLVIAFIIGYSSMLLRSKINHSIKDDDETSLQTYVQGLKERFKNSDGNNIERSVSDSLNGISKINLDEK